MSRPDDFLGGLHYDSPREERVDTRTGVFRYHRVQPAEKRVTVWWHLGAVPPGALAAVVAAFAWGYGVDQFDEVRVRGLVALGLAGLLVGVVCLGRLSPAAPLTAGVLAITFSVVHELGLITLLPVLRPVFDSGSPILVGVLLIVSGLRRR
ncbi:hypothetical protein [Saccharothrix syringae]|uniref:Uncharacterized protein n=1 Tax=Saccharothrix syringae TaxID=103733 RepID=A0A5Q0HE33_SACSY|nr:hypothetical protein [Saccharothrix syringae]QFZ23842.1 hypothetical protein EKG83_46075 [Saccharothrix syringae]